MKIERSGITLGTAFGARVVLSWWFFLAAILFGRESFSLAFLFSFLLLILFHELGHAIVVHSYGHRVIEINVHGLGGFCRWSGYASAHEITVIAWGGVLAQLAALVAVVLLQVVAPVVAAQLPPEVFRVFIWDSLLIMGLNLLPIEPLDGGKAWAIVPRLLKRYRKRTARIRLAVERVRERRSAKAQIRRLDSIEVTDEMIEEAGRWAEAELFQGKGGGAGGQDDPGEE